MSFVEPPPRKPSDDLDGLLRAFFRGQMPRPWPAPPTPHASGLPLRRPETKTRNLIRSRWALAASIALLILGSLLLPGRFSQAPAPAPSLDAPGTAGRDIIPGARKGPRVHGPEKDQQVTPAPDEDRQFPEMDDSDMRFDR